MNIYELLQRPDLWLWIARGLAVVVAVDAVINLIGWAKRRRSKPPLILNKPPDCTIALPGGIAVIAINGKSLSETVHILEQATTVARDAVAWNMSLDTFEDATRDRAVAADGIPPARWMAVTF